MPPPVIAIEINSVKANKDIASIRNSLGNLKKQVSSLSRSVKKVNFKDMQAGKVTPQLKNMNVAINRNTRALNKFRGGLKKTGTAAKKAAKDIKGTKGRVTELSKSIQIALGPLSGVAARLTAFSSLASGASIAIAGMVAGTIALAAAFLKTVSAGKQMETSLLQVEQIIRVTGSAAGKTTSEINELSISIAKSTLANVKDIRDASAVLLTFISVTGKAFDKTLRLSQDLAQLGFGTARNAAVQLGKALEDPRIGLTALRRVGVSFTVQLRDQIIELTELGRRAEAVTLILENLETQVGGVGQAAAQGLAGQIDLLADNFTRLFEVLAEDSGIIESLTEAFKGLNVAFDKALTNKTVESLREAITLQEKLRSDAEKARKESRGFDLMFMLGGTTEPSAGPIFDPDRLRLLKGLLADLLTQKDELAEGKLMGEADAELTAAQLRLDDLTLSLKKLTDATLPGSKAFRDYELRLKILKEIFEDTDPAIKALIPTQERYNELIKGVTIAYQNAAASARFWDKALRNATQAAAQANRIIKRTIDARNRAFTATEQQIESILRESQALLISGKSRKVELEVLKAEIRLKKANIDITKEETVELLDQLRKVAELRERVREAVRDETEILKDFTKVIGTAFEDALVKGASFRDLLKSIEEDLIRIVTRIAITKPFESALETAITGGKLDKDAEGIEKIGFSLGKLLRDIFGFGNQKLQDELKKETEKALALLEKSRGKNLIATNAATTAVQALADAAIEASIALKQLVLVTPEGVLRQKDIAENLAFQRGLPGGGFGGPDDEGLEDAVAAGVKRGIGGGPGGPDDAGQEFTGAAKRLVDALDADIAALELEVIAKKASEAITTIQTATVQVGTVATQAETAATNTLTPALTAAAAAANSFAASAGGGGIGGGIVSSILGQGVTPGADFTAANIDFLGFTAKGGVRSKGSRNLVRSFDSGGIADSPSIAVFGEKRGQKEAFVPLPNSGKIPVELGGDVGGGITINGPLMVVETRDLESFEQSDTQVAANILGILQRSQRNT